MTSQLSARVQMRPAVFEALIVLYEFSGSIKAVKRLFQKIYLNKILTIVGILLR